MIKPYEKISIIYGGTGRVYANMIKERLKAMHEANGYPYTPAIMDEPFLGNNKPLLELVKEAIQESRLSILILTFDDVNNTRVRQNVLIEFGMVFMALDSSRECYFLSERKELPSDFPSDIRGQPVNYFDAANADQAFDKLVKHINEKLMKNKTYINILEENEEDKYKYRYNELLDDIPNSVFEKDPDFQLHEVLRRWEENIKKFDYSPEKIMYLLERIKFFTLFKRDDELTDFFDHVKEEIKRDNKDYDGCKRQKYIKHLIDMACNIIDYSKYKLDEKNDNVYRDPSSFSPERVKEVSDKFKNFYTKLKTNLIELTNDDIEYNWLIMILLKEYCALALMRHVALAGPDANVEKKINDAIRLYDETINIANERCNDYDSSNLFRGYAEFNIARAYKELYLLKGDEETLEQLKLYVEKAYLTRGEWLGYKSKGVFTSALSLEYYDAKKYDLELQNSLKGYSEATSEEIAKSLISLRNEVEERCNNSELGRLHEMIRKINKFHEKVTKPNANEKVPS